MAGGMVDDGGWQVGLVEEMQEAEMEITKR